MTIKPTKIEIFITTASLVFLLIAYVNLQHSNVIGTQFEPERPVSDVMQEVGENKDENLAKKVMFLCDRDCPEGYYCDLQEFRYCEVTGVR